MLHAWRESKGWQPGRSTKYTSSTASLVREQVSYSHWHRYSFYQNYPSFYPLTQLTHPCICHICLCMSMYIYSSLLIEDKVSLANFNENEVKVKKVKPCLWQSAASTWKVYIPGLVIRTYPFGGIGEHWNIPRKSQFVFQLFHLFHFAWCTLRCTQVHRMRWHDFRRFKYDKKISISQQRNPSSELRNLRSIVDTAFVRFCSCAVVHSAFRTCDFWTWEFRKRLATWSKCSVVAICKYQSFPCLCMSIVAQYILHLKKPSQQSEDTESSRAKAALQLSSVVATDVGFEWFWGNETYLSKLWLWINICCDRLEIEWLVCLRLHTLMVMCQAKQLLNQLGMRWERVRPGPGSWGRWFVKVKRRRFN